MMFSKEEYWLHLQNKLKQSFPESYESIYSTIYTTFKYPVALISLILYITGELLSIILLPFTLVLHLTWNYPYITFCSFIFVSLLYLLVFRVILRRLYQIDLVDYFLYSFIPYVTAIAYTVLDIFFPIINVASLVLKTLLYPLTYLFGFVEKFEPRAGSVRQTAEVWKEYRQSKKIRNRRQPTIRQEEVRTYAQTQAVPAPPEPQPYSLFRIAYAVFRFAWKSIYFIFSLIFPFLKKLKDGLTIIFHPVDTVCSGIDTIHLRAEGVRKTMHVWTPQRRTKKTQLQILNEERNAARSECCNCQYNHKNVLLQPCGHHCLCQKCAQVLLTLKDPHCPICRFNVTSITRD